MKRVISLGILALAIIGSLAFSSQENFKLGRDGSKPAPNECCTTISRDSYAK